MMKLIGKMFGIDSRKKKKVPHAMENWFQIEYGKNWERAYDYYMTTGSIHYKS